MPYSMIEPIRDILSSPIKAKRWKWIARWIRVLSRSKCRRPKWELTVDLAEIGTTFEKILNMRAGDVLPINVPELVTAKVDGVPVMVMRLRNFQWSIRVARPEDDQRNRHDEGRWI